MSAFIRDQLAAARINLMKRRAAAAWKKRQAAKPCPDCGQVHPPVFAFLHVPEEDDDKPAANRPLN